MMENTLRWIARILALLLIAVAVLFFVGEGLSEGLDFPSLTIEEQTGFGAYGVMLLGMILAWKWESAALISIIGYLMFCLIEGHLLFGLFAAYPLVSILFLIVRILEVTPREWERGW